MGWVDEIGNPGDWLDYGKKKLGQAWDWYDEGTTRGADEEKRLGEEGERASGFAGESQGRFGDIGGQLGGQADVLRGLASGKDSISRLQLAQALQQNQAQQQSMAAGARPGNAAMAARTAAMTAGRQGAGLAGQQAIAGIQERQAAQNALAKLLLAQRQQELNATQGARGQSLGAFGTRYTGALGQPTGIEKGLGAVSSLGQGFGLLG